MLVYVHERVKAHFHDRTDAAYTIINSFLERSRWASGQRRKSTNAFSVAVAECMERSSVHQESGQREVEWMPPPNDATGPDGHSHGARDAFSTLVMLEGRPKFIEVLKQVIAARLTGSAALSDGPQEDQNQVVHPESQQPEMRLLNALKLRFPSYDITECEVMLRDLSTSQNLNQAIARHVAPHAKHMGLDVVDFKAFVLSRNYWPIQEDWEGECKWSTQMETYARLWAEGYRTEQSQRRLQWLPCAGRASIAMVLQDRTIETDCAPFQAAVIQCYEQKDPGPAGLTVAEMVEMTSLDEDLVQLACDFWVQKVVLYKTHDVPTHYAVLETRPTDTDEMDISPAVQAPATAAPLAKTPAQQVQENGAVYSQFIVGMLTNQGTMPAARIKQLLGVFVPSGFPHAEEVLVDFLEQMAEENLIRRQGDNWRAIPPAT